MNILVDADACPVIDIIEKVAFEYKLKLSIFSDIYHNLKVDYGRVVKVDRAYQSVDIAIVNECQQGDIVITQDYGLASLILGKGGYALNHNGQTFTKGNIGYFLMKRHQNLKIRKGGGRHKGPKKRTEIDNLKFEEVFRKVVEENISL